MTTESSPSWPPRPAYVRAVTLIDALNREFAPRVLHGALQVLLIAQANDIDRDAERHRGGAHD